MNLFPSAQQARNGVVNMITIHNEIRFIENEILIAISMGLLSETVDDSPMASNSYYNDVWRGFIVDDVITYQMEEVKRYFNNLDYKIKQIENGPDNFTWEIKW